MELLEYLADKVGCTYMSDLRFLPPNQLCFPFLEGIPLENFSEKDWLEAVMYLYQQQVGFAALARLKLIFPGKIGT